MNCFNMGDGDGDDNVGFVNKSVCYDCIDYFYPSVVNSIDDKTKQNIIQLSTCYNYTLDLTLHSFPLAPILKQLSITIYNNLLINKLIFYLLLALIYLICKFYTILIFWKDNYDYALIYP